MDGIDIVMQIWRLLNVPQVTALLNGGDIWQHNRPRNSKFTDIVISIPEYNSSALNTGFIDVNLHTPNQLLDILHKDGVLLEDNTFPDLPVFKPLLDAVLPLLVSTSDFSLTTKIVGVPIRDKDGEWYVNIRIAFEGLNPDLSVDVSLLEETSVGDGYGGVSVSLASIWTGKGVKTDIKVGSQLSVNAGRYEFNLSCDWILPNTATPKKNMQLNASDGRYVINGIVDYNGLWRLSTVRKDG